MSELQSRLFAFEDQIQPAGFQLDVSMSRLFALFFGSSVRICLSRWELDGQKLWETAIFLYLHYNLWRSPDAVAAESTLFDLITSIQFTNSFTSCSIILLFFNHNLKAKHYLLQNMHIHYIGLTCTTYLYLFLKVLQCNVKNRIFFHDFSIFQLISQVIMPVLVFSKHSTVYLSLN